GRVAVLPRSGRGPGGAPRRRRRRDGALEGRPDLLQLRRARSRQRELLRRRDPRPPARDPRALRPVRAVPRQPAHPARGRRLVDRKQYAAGAIAPAAGPAFSAAQVALAASATWPFPLHLEWPDDPPAARRSATARGRARRALARVPRDRARRGGGRVRLDLDRRSPALPR